MWYQALLETFIKKKYVSALLEGKKLFAPQHTACFTVVVRAVFKQVIPRIRFDTLSLRGDLPALRVYDVFVDDTAPCARIGHDNPREMAGLYRAQKKANPQKFTTGLLFTGVVPQGNTVSIRFRVRAVVRRGEIISGILSEISRRLNISGKKKKIVQNTGSCRSSGKV